MSQITKRILLVDDSRIARLTLQHLITSTDSSVEITQAANGDEALAARLGGDEMVALLPSITASDQTLERALNT